MTPKTEGAKFEKVVSSPKATPQSQEPNAVNVPQPKRPTKSGK